MLYVVLAVCSRATEGQAFSPLLGHAAAKPSALLRQNSFAARAGAVEAHAVQSQSQRLARIRGGAVMSGAVVSEAVTLMVSSSPACRMPSPLKAGSHYPLLLLHCADARGKS